jgi:hypothetical protein
MRQIAKADAREEPFSGLVELWTLLSAASTGLLATIGVLAWDATPKAQPFTPPWLILVLTTVIATTTEIRFFLGHRNYLRSVLREHGSDGVIQWKRARWEFLMICLIKACQLALAVTISNPRGFLKAFVALMLSDLIWIAFEPRVRNLENVRAFKPCRWMCVNLATALLILVGSLFTSHSIELCAMGTIWQLAIAATNCFADLCTCSGPVKR